MGLCRGSSIKNIDWRVDVALSSASAASVLRSFVLLKLTLSDSRVLNFEMTVEEFQAFRFDVASSLSALQNLPQ
ncbi:hypothetical protein P9112_002849 [Eukaryota sp. TZLM1-RC]